MSVSAVIVTYNSGRVLGRCLQSLAGTGLEVIVVDNASEDDTKEVALRYGARLLANVTNRGFAAGANQGAQAASGDAILLLNPDTILVQGLDQLVKALDQNPAAGAAAGVLIDSVSGLPQAGFSVRRFPSFATLGFEVLGTNRLLPRNPVNVRYRCLDLDLSSAQEVDQPAGACLLVKKQVWEGLGGFDESYYPLWFEDVDFCLRLRRSGLRILLEPTCQLLHSGGHSLETIGFIERQLYWYGNLFYYVRKNIGFTAMLGMRVLVCVGALFRMAAAVVSGRFSQIEAFRAVIRLAFSGKRIV